MESANASPAAAGTDSRRGSVLGWVVPLLAAFVKEQGHASDPILQLPGIRGRDLTDPDVRVPEAASREVWRLAMTITGDDAIGLHVAQWLPRGALDLIEFAFRTSATLADGLDRLARYGRLINDRLAGHVLRTGPGVRFLMGVADARPLHPQRAEFSIALALRLAREATALPLIPVEVLFAHPAPADLREHQEFFRSPIHFANGVNGMVFRDADGARALRAADAELGAVIRRRLDTALEKLDKLDQPADASTAARVRRLLVAGMGQEKQSVTTVGRELGLSARTLSRRLGEEGTSFRDIQDQVRHELALALLGDTRVSIAEVAFFLGYAEPAPFHRSFKRWTGTTPQLHRRGVEARSRIS
jgi:AraC-like DNA-binding protein